MRFETVLRMIVVVALLAVVAGATKCILDIRMFVAKTHLATDEPNTDAIETAYRNCLRREAGMVGVVSLKQMSKCEAETGYGK